MSTTLSHEEVHWNLADLLDGGGPVLSCLHHPIDNDQSLAELAALPLGWYAERSKLGEPWLRKKHASEDAPQ